MGNTPSFDNNSGYPTVLGSPFTSPLTPTSSIQYAGVDQNYPIAEFSAKIDDATLTDLLYVVNKYFGITLTLAGLRDTSPSGDAVKLFNLVIQSISGYNRTLYNYALPILNLGVLIAKKNGISVTPTAYTSPMNSLIDNTTEFIHATVLKLFETMSQEGRTYNEMALQAFGGTDRDGLDWENKYARLTHFWRNKFSSTITNDIKAFSSLFSHANNLSSPLFNKLDVRTTNVSGNGVLTRTSTGNITIWGNPSIESATSLIGFLKEFTFPVGTYNSDGSLLYTKSNADVVGFMKSIKAGTYMNIVDEAKLVGSPLIPSVFSYRNAYSLNPTISYSLLLGPFPPLPVSAPALAQYPPAITYGDYLVILIWRLFNKAGLPTTGSSPGRPTDVLITIQPNMVRTTSTVYVYNDIVTMVNAISAYITANSLSAVTLPPFGTTPSVLPNFEVEPSPAIISTTVPDNGFSVMATFFPNNTFKDGTIYTTTVPVLYSLPLFGDANTSGIFDQIKVLFPDVVSILTRLFRVNPPTTASPSFTAVSGGSGAPITSLSINTNTNFVQQQAVINLWNTSVVSDLDFIYDSSLDNTLQSASSLYDNGSLANLTLAYTLFTMLSQEYVNITSTTLSSPISTYFVVSSLSGYPGYYKYTFSGDLVSLTRATLIILDRLYVYFAGRFSISNMMAFNPVLLTSNPPVPISQPTPGPVLPYASSAIAQLMGLTGGISTSAPTSITYDPINYTAFLSFATLLNYNYDFVRELTQDVSIRYLLNNQVTVNEGQLAQTMLDLERRVNYLQPVSGYNSDVAFNPFNAYQNGLNNIT